jgi:hypothetical protein
MIALGPGISLNRSERSSDNGAWQPPHSGHGAFGPVQGIPQNFDAVDGPSPRSTTGRQAGRVTRFLQGPKALTILRGFMSRM